MKLKTENKNKNKSNKRIINKKDKWLKNQIIYIKIWKIVLPWYVVQCLSDP